MEHVKFECMYFRYCRFERSMLINLHERAHSLGTIVALADNFQKVRIRAKSKFEILLLTAIHSIGCKAWFLQEINK